MSFSPRRTILLVGLALDALIGASHALEVPQMEAVKHSALQNLTALSETTNATQEVSERPEEQGLFIKHFNGTNVSEAQQYGLEHNVTFPFLISNDGTKPMCFLGGAS